MERRDEDRLMALALTSAVDDAAPERRVGGGGGGLLSDGGGGGDVVGVCSADGREPSGWDDSVAAELLRERESDDFSWLCRREIGGVGGLRRCGAAGACSGVLVGGGLSAGSSAEGKSDGSLGGTGSAGGGDGRSFCLGPDDPRGRGGSGL